MRDFSDAFLDDYLREEGTAILDSVGCYRLEGRGSQLFARIDGDYFAILGLPLLPLLTALRDQGIIARMTTRLAGVIGWPVAHSLSPRLHRILAAGTWRSTAPMCRSPCGARISRPWSTGLRRAGFAGVNVTIPHKQAAFAHCPCAR